jgi:hypothetical protein
MKLHSPQLECRLKKAVRESLQPMSSPQMTTMLGFFSAARAGADTQTAAAHTKQKAFSSVFFMVFFFWGLGFHFVAMSCCDGILYFGNASWTVNRNAQSGALVGCSTL